MEASSDPNVLCGTPCCPGVVEGMVRVVRSIEETEVSEGGRWEGDEVERVVRD